jgi:flagellar protein FlgJ
VTAPISSTPSAGTPATGAGSDRRQTEMRQAAQAFEAIFLRQMLGSMRQAKLADDVFGSSATDQFRDMADGELANSMARQGGFGIADMLVNQFTRRSGGGQ